MARSKRHEKKPKHKDKHHAKPPGNDGGSGGTVTEQLKAKSSQSGQDAMNAAPGVQPADPANAEAVFTTGPGQAVEYDYQRQGTYADDYAAQQGNQVMSGEVSPLPSGAGQVTTGAAGNPT